MNNINIDFEILDKSEHAPKKHKRATGHFIFDVKMCFSRKSRWVLDGHKTLSPEGSTCAGLVSREFTRIDFMCAALSGIYFFLRT